MLCKLAPRHRNITRIVCGMTRYQLSQTHLTRISMSEMNFGHSYQAVKYFSTNNDKKENNSIKKPGDPPKKSFDIKKITSEAATSIVSFGKRAGSSIYEFFRHPSAIPSKMKSLWQVVKDEAHHYWVGTKLLWAEIKTTNDIVGRVLQGHMMSRRERLQLIRTTMDLLRLIPFSVFVIVPFMELLLPFAIKLFPNMLPSTFEDSLKKEEALKKELAMRLGVAGFFIETFRGMAERRQKGNSGDDEGTATELIEFMEKAKMGESLPNDAVIRISRMFKDELTLGNMARPQLVTMCQFMGLVPYGSDAFLRFQLRSKLKAITEDDKRILWEGVDSLTHQELRDACQERGMRATGLNTFGYRKQMKEWLDLSTQKQIPIALLIMSRAFVLKTTELNTKVYTAEESLKTSLTAFDEEVINEIIVQSADSSENNNPKIKKRKLESIMHQNELIREEIEIQTEAKKKLEEEKIKASQNVPVVSDSPSISKIEDSTSSRLIGVPSSGDILPPSIEAGPAPLAPSTSTTPLVAAVDNLQKKAIISDSSTATNVGSPTEMIIKESAEQGDSQKELSVAELVALTDLINDSAVEREKTELAALQEVIGTLEHEIELELKIEQDKEEKRENISTNEKKGEVESDSDSEVDDPSIRRLRSVLKGMMKKIEVRVKHTEDQLGKKLQQLDKDRDGILDSNELREAVMKILKKKDLSAEEIQNFIQLLDQDNDGKVSVEELKMYVSTKIKQEKDAYETQKPKDVKEISNE